MIQIWFAKLIAKYSVLPIAVTGFVLLVISLFAGIAGLSAIKSKWFEHKADNAETRANTAEHNAKVLEQDAKQATKAAEIAADTTHKQDKTATGQRQNTAKAIEVIHERIVKEPVVMLTVIDPVVLAEAHQARTRAQAAADRVSGTQSP